MQPIQREAIQPYCASAAATWRAAAVNKDERQRYSLHSPVVQPELDAARCLRSGFARLAKGDRQSRGSLRSCRWAMGPRMGGISTLPGKLQIKVLLLQSKLARATSKLQARIQHQSCTSSLLCAFTVLAANTGLQQPVCDCAQLLRKRSHGVSVPSAYTQ